MNCKRMQRGGSRAASAYADGPRIERVETRARMNRARKERSSSRGVEAEALPATSDPWPPGRREDERQGAAIARLIYLTRGGLRQFLLEAGLGG